MDRQADGWMNG
jgi:hypothetical protein